MEHFVREITFSNASKPFGFVVPVPAKPEVEKVTESPFPSLNQHYPFSNSDASEGFGSKGAPRGAAGGIGGPRGVEVIEAKKVGSFTSFVIAADDPAAFRAWLEKNQFDTNAESERWLAHYVALKFVYVALRYDAPAAGAPGPSKSGAPVSALGSETKSETLRISFPTDLPFYPYLEPGAPSGSGPRVLAVWFMSEDPMVPVAVGPGGGTPWKRPWEEGRRFADLGRYATTGSLPNELRKFVPETTPKTVLGIFKPASLTVQHFEDQKKSRKGWGDVVFVPSVPSVPSKDEGALRAKMAPLLDPKTGALQ